MITGFNTDIKHGNRVFHVQTEDKGTENPFVESLVYVGGEIVASKKTPYSEPEGEGPGPAAIQEMMEAQHRKMIAAVQRGRFDSDTKTSRPSEKSDSFNLHPPASEIPVDIPPGVVVVDKASKTDEKTLDQVILDYLASEVSQEHLDLTLYSSPDFYLGETVEMRLKAETSLSRRPIVGAAILVKVISTVDKPAIVYQGKTTGDGSCTATCKLPSYRSGNAALIIQATSDAGNSEIKYLLRTRK
ncbi:MAG: hypothetical protein ACRD16_01330 [Thermoanaerobaculia bacterium]